MKKVELMGRKGNSMAAEMADGMVDYSVDLLVGNLDF